MRQRAFMVIILTAMLFLPSFARAQEDAYLSEEHLPRLADLAEADYINGILFPAFNGAGQEAQLPYVLKLTLDDGWYSYWRTPGDSGLAPTFDWSKSVNVKEAVIEWPAPQRFEQDGLYSFGYKGVIEMPVTVVPQDVGKGVTVALTYNAIVCNKICVPQTLNITHTIPAGPAVQSPYYNYFKDIKARSTPRPQDDISIDTGVLGKDALVFTVTSKHGFKDADIFVESPDMVLSAPPAIDVDADNPTVAVMKIKAPLGADLTQVLFGKTLSVTVVVGGDFATKQFTF